MAPPSKDIAPAVNAKWLALRQKHQDDSNKLQREVLKSRAEFEARVEKARVALLEKQMSEECEFWCKNGNGSGAAKCAPSVSKAARTQTPASARAGTVAPKKPPTLAARSSSSRPAVPRFEVDTPVTPSKESQAKSSKPPPTPTKLVRQPPQKGGKPVVIDLCGESDDEKLPPSKKTPAASKTATPSAIQHEPVGAIRDSTMEEHVSPGHEHSKMSSVMPEATLELFGGGSSSRPFATLAPRVKEEGDQNDIPQLNSSFRFPSMPPVQKTNSLPSASPCSPFSQRASTAAPQSTQSAFVTPPLTLEHGQRNDDGLKASSVSFAQRATSAVPASPQSSASNSFARSTIHRQHGDFSFGRASPLGGFGQCAGLASPSSQGFGFSNQSHSQFSSPTTQDSEQGISGTNPFVGPVSLSPHYKASGQLDVEDQGGATLNKAYLTDDGGVANTVHDGRGEGLGRGGCNATDIDMEMAEASSAYHDTSLPATSPAATTSIVSTEHISSSSARPRDSFQKSQSTAPARQSRLPVQQTWTQQLPSPSPSHASVVSEATTPDPPHVSTAASSIFKKPLLPASADLIKTYHRAIGPEARHVRAGTVDSRASSFTLPAETRTQRGISVASRGSGISGHTGAAASSKRKLTFDLSDEEDGSDYAPSEPESPLAGKRTRPAEGPTIKKSKTSNGSSLASNVSSRAGQPVHRNAYGFKAGTLSKPKLSTSSAATTTTPRKTPAPIATAISGRASTSRPASAQVKPKPKPAPAAKKPQPHMSNSYFGKRAAAVKAEDKIHDIYQETEEFATELAIEAADELEDARLPENMGRMSITPAPQDAETVDILATPPNKGRGRAAVADEDDSEAEINYDIKSDKSWRARR